MENVLQQIRERLPATIIAFNDVGTMSGDVVKTPLGYLPHELRLPFRISEPLRIGMIDDRVDPDLPWFQDRVEFKSFVKDIPSNSDRSHGNAIATLLVANTDMPERRGLLPSARLSLAGIIKVRSGRKSGSVLSMALALNWLMEQHVQIINMSLQLTRSNRILTNLLEVTADSGVVLVAAAGNGSYNDRKFWPAAHAKVIAVTAVARDFSIYRNANSGDYIDFAAPGVGISIWDGRRDVRYSGTSFATPFIVALASRRLSRYRALESTKIIQVLKRNAIDLGAPGKDPIFGWGFPYAACVVN